MQRAATPLAAENSPGAARYEVTRAVREPGGQVVFDVRATMPGFTPQLVSVTIGPDGTVADVTDIGVPGIVSRSSRPASAKQSPTACQSSAGGRDSRAARVSAPDRSNRDAVPRRQGRRRSRSFPNRRPDSSSRGGMY